MATPSTSQAEPRKRLREAVPGAASALLAPSAAFVPAWLMRSAFAVAALGMAWQTIQGHRQGFMYCGTTERVYKAERPTKYRVFVVVQWALVLMLLLFAATWKNTGAPTA